ARQLLLNAHRISDDQGKSQWFVIAIQDASAERANIDHRQWFETTLQSIGDAVITTDTEARVTFMNPTAERLTGWNWKDANGRPLLEVFNIVNEDTRHTVESPVTKAIRMGVI